MLAAIGRFLTAPFRWIARTVFGRGARSARKSAAGYAAKGLGGEAPSEESIVERDRAGGVLFVRLQRPTLVERTAADMTLNEAREYAAQAEKFYAYPFPLFARSDFFYEEVEQDHLNHALGLGEGAADENFLMIMQHFRRVLNANTRRLFLFYAPMLLVLTLAAAFYLAPGLSEVTALAVGGSEAKLALYLADALIATLALALLLLLYHWPYKVIQQHNLLGLDNYITSKFSRINQNFQVAKRRAMNVERNKRMPQADELRQEAGDWTIAYHWLALRLFFCEMTVRNAVYQIRRNTGLYDLGGVVLSVALTAGAIFGFGHIDAARDNFWIEAVGVAGVFVVAGYILAMGGATRETLSVMQPREWNRFHLIDLDQTIRDHVGEDKLQIVTFRDRNRIE
ncbi:MAG: hypothetical protein AAFX08_01675 [Pseudomonadota bacterium]